MSGYLEDTGDWPFRESAPLRSPPEPDPEPEPEPRPEAAAPLMAEPEQSEAVDEAPPEVPEMEPEEVVAVPEAEAAEVHEEQEPEPEEWPEPEEVPEPEPPEAAGDEELAAEHAGGGLDVPAGYAVLSGTPSGERRTVGVVVGRFNGEITNRLLESALAELESAGVAPEAVTVMPVPGAFELPLAAMALAKTRRYACVVALGCVIRGETPHFDFVAGEAASGLQLAAVETGVPVSFGLLTCETREQAEARVDKGSEAVRAALEMADLFAQLRAQATTGR